MSALRAMVVGVGRALGYPGVAIGLWLVNFLLAVPAAWVLTSSIHESIEFSRVHESLKTGLDMGWFGEYQAAAKGLETTFTPTVVGAGAFFNNLEAWVSGKMFTGFPGLVGLGLVYILVWALLLGGVLERYAHPVDAHSAARFFQSGSRFFFRFIRLALVSGMLYFLVYRLHKWLYGQVEELTRDATAERTVLVYSLVVVALTAFLLVLLHISFAYAKIATVVEDRRSMLLATFRGLGFVLSNPGKTLGLYFGLTLTSIALLALYTWIAPGAGQATAGGVLFAFVVGQLFLLARLMVRLSLLGGETALYQALTRRGYP